MVEAEEVRAYHLSHHIGPGIAPNLHSLLREGNRDVHALSARRLLLSYEDGDSRQIHCGQPLRTQSCLTANCDGWKIALRRWDRALAGLEYSHRVHGTFYESSMLAYAACRVIAMT